jgi:hypothetical protein
MYKALEHTSQSDNLLRPPTGFIHLGNGLSSQLIEEVAITVVGCLLPANLFAILYDIFKATTSSA